jgi:hypothetical protein
MAHNVLYCLIIQVFSFFIFSSALLYAILALDLGKEAFTQVYIKRHLI